MNSIATANSSIAAALIRENTANTRATIPNSTAPATLAKVAATLASVEATVATGGDAAIATIIARILARAGAATPSNSAQTPIADLGIILTELLNPTNDAAPMDLNLNQLLNSTMLQKAMAQLPPELLSKPQVIEALVLQNTLLSATDATGEQIALPLLQMPNASATAATLATPSPLYRINMQWQNRLIQLLSPQPLPTGTRVTLQIDTRGTLTLLRPEIAAKILLAQNAAANTATTPPRSAPTPAQAMQQSLRELLPRQQALHTLVPLLQKFITPSARAQLPQSVFKALAQLLQALPKPAQVTNAENLRQTLNNSGSFFEARLARALTADPATAEALPKIFAGDLKAQIGALLEIIRKFAPDIPAHATPPNAEDDFIYAAKPSLQQAAPHGTPHTDSNNLDTLLTQLSKLLEAGFARIQLNQLDSASARHLNHETQTPVPTWVLELPLRTPHGVDQLQLRIEQRRKQHQQQTRVQWNVEIAFDLHAAGKLAVSLAIVEKTVSATLWAEREQTHMRVREEMDYLRAGLESVGVKVTEMRCRLGLPVPRSNPISQQLVDVHT